MITPSFGEASIKLRILAVLMGGFVSCATYTGETSRMREAFNRGDYDLALEALEDSGLKNRSQDRLLWRLEAATILDRKGEYAKSRELWFQADRIADELFTLSLSRTAASFVASERSTDYDGEDYEVVAIHAMLAHQFIALGQLDEARVEARRINTKLNEINQKTDPKGNYKYREDAHARYLSALIYETRGEWDPAIVDYRKALELYEGDFSGYVIGMVPTGLIRGLRRCLQIRGRSSLARSLLGKYDHIIDGDDSIGGASRASSFGEIIVIHESGRVARKLPKEQFMTVQNQLVRFSSPMIIPNPLQNIGTGVDLGSSGFIAAENTVYFDAIAKDSLEHQRDRKVAKQMSRLLLKGQINYSAQKQFGPVGGLAMNILNNATETADTRSWTTLPQAFFITRARVAPGSYDVIFQTNGTASKTQKVAVTGGQIKLFRAFDR